VILKIKNIQNSNKTLLIKHNLLKNKIKIWILKLIMEMKYQNHLSIEILEILNKKLKNCKKNKVLLKIFILRKEINRLAIWVN